MDTDLRTSLTKAGFTIRVTDERWIHITESHDYMAGYLDHVIETVEDPDWLVKGWADEIIAIKQYPVSSSVKKISGCGVQRPARWFCDNSIYDFKT